MNKEINIKIFNKSYKTHSAKKGLGVLKRLIDSNDEYSLEELLRNHREKEIKYFLEIEYRDNVDDLLEYYSLLEIGIIAGYFPKSLTNRINAELRQILGNRFVQVYYKDIYPLYLPQLLYKNIRNQNHRVAEESGVKEFYFEKFLLINDSIKSDIDVDQFLWFLDDGDTGGFSISDFWQVLEDVDRIEYKLQTTVSHPLNHALWGFIKYLEFLHQYAELLREVDNFRFLQSAFWHFQSYWFDNLQNKLGIIIVNGIENIRRAILNTSNSKLIQNRNSYIANERDFVEWRDNIDALNSIEEDINYLRNERFKNPVIEILQN